MKKTLKYELSIALAIIMLTNPLYAHAMEHSDYPEPIVCFDVTEEETVHVDNELPRIPVGATATATSTATSTATATATLEALPTATINPLPTATSTATATATHSPVETPDIPFGDATATPTANPTVTPTMTPIVTPTEYPAEESIAVTISSNKAALIINEKAHLSFEGINPDSLHIKGKNAYIRDGIFSCSSKGIVKLYSVINNKKTLICKIKIEQPKIKNKLSLRVNKSKLLKVKGTTRTVEKWTSSDEAIAKVDNNGRITGVASGNAVISAFIGDYEYKCMVQVK